MNSIYTICEELLTFHIDKEFEISELANLPILAVKVKDGEVSSEGEMLTASQVMEVLYTYKFRELLPKIGVDLTIIGYVREGQFFIFSVFVDGEESELTPEKRVSFMDFYGFNEYGVRLRHVPVFQGLMKLDGAKQALESGVSMEEVVKYTTKSITELCSGISPMTGSYRKGLVFKSRTDNFSFKAYSEETMLNGVL